MKTDAPITTPLRHQPPFLFFRGQTEDQSQGLSQRLRSWGDRQDSSDAFLPREQQDVLSSSCPQLATSGNKVVHCDKHYISLNRLIGNQLYIPKAGLMKILPAGDENIVMIDNELKENILIRL